MPKAVDAYRHSWPLSQHVWQHVTMRSHPLQPRSTKSVYCNALSHVRKIVGTWHFWLWQMTLTVRYGDPASVGTDPNRLSTAGPLDAPGKFATILHERIISIRQRPIMATLGDPWEYTLPLLRVLWQKENTAADLLEEISLACVA